MTAEQNIDVRPRNWLAPVVLVALREESSYGYVLANRLAEFGFEEINPGTLYKLLRKMETEGLCESRWDTSNDGPACRVYSVTNEGEAYLVSWAEGGRKYQLVLDSFYLAYAGRYPSASEESEAS
jgi:PadR family transcriptional regulator, regulatory protein PadR